MICGVGTVKVTSKQTVRRTITTKMLSDYETSDNKILNILNEQRRTGQFCDVIIKLNTGFSMPCHFCVIASQSLFVGNKYFLQKDMQFSIHNPLTIEIYNFECEECLCYIIDFMYCSQDVTIYGDHSEHIKLLIKILRIDNAQELKQFFSLESEAANTEDIIFKVENKQRRINHGFQYKTQQTQPAQSKKHNCNGCNFKCYRPSEMLIHINNCQSDNKKCSLCETTFETMTEFKGHLVRHDNEKPFFCKECDVRFITKTALNLHTPKHSNTTNHMCPYCGKGFKWKHGLNNHLIVHSSEKKLLCDECGYSTNHLKTLRAHQLTHGGQVFRCTANNCLYTSRRKENLKIHIATHRNETPFVCEICGHRFSQNKNLKRHALVHLSKNMHKCPHCTFSSYRTDKLKEHIARLHTEKPLQLELSEDVQSALKDSDVDGVLFDETSKVPKVELKRKGSERNRSAKKNADTTVKKAKFILPKPDSFL